jgi:lysyl-tRNA synthetase class I
MKVKSEYSPELVLRQRPPLHTLYNWWMTLNATSEIAEAKTALLRLSQFLMYVEVPSSSYIFIKYFNSMLKMKSTN